MVVVERVLARRDEVIADRLDYRNTALVLN